jgi:hypothetical protein
MTAACSADSGFASTPVPSVSTACELTAGSRRSAASGCARGTGPSAAAGVRLAYTLVSGAPPARTVDGAWHGPPYPGVPSGSACTACANIAPPPARMAGMTDTLRSGGGEPRHARTHRQDRSASALMRTDRVRMPSSARRPRRARRHRQAPRWTDRRTGRARGPRRAPPRRRTAGWPASWPLAVLASPTSHAW